MSTTGGLTKGYHTWMWGREDQLRAVLAAVDDPDPDPHIDCPVPEFTARSTGLVEAGHQHFPLNLVDYGLAEIVGFRAYQRETATERRAVYRLTDVGRDTIEERLNAVAMRSGPLPCAESETCRGDSFENPRGIDGVRCKDCQTVYSRSEVRL